jgi:ribosome-associated protein
MNKAQSEQLARQLATVADSKKAEEVIVLDMRELVSYTDFLAICTARSERQARAIVDEVRVRVKRESGLLPGGVDAGGEAGWTILDSLDCVLHVFTPEARERYGLEDLWRDAPRLELEFDTPEASEAASA